MRHGGKASTSGGMANTPEARLPAVNPLILSTNEKAAK
jgi:hypothetical protein